MLCYMDMTFCGYWQECRLGKTCPRRLTELVSQTAAALNLQVAQYADCPDCFETLPVKHRPGDPIRTPGTFPGKCWQCSQKTEIYPDSELCAECDNRAVFYAHIAELMMNGELTECPFVAGEELLKGCLDYHTCVKCTHHKPVTPTKE